MASEADIKVQRGLVSLVVAVTGHRDLDPATAPVVLQEIAAILKRLSECYRHTPIVVITGMAEGADMLAVQAVDELRRQGHERIGCRPVLPFRKDEYRHDFQTPESKAAFLSGIERYPYTTLPVHPCHTYEQICVAHSPERRQQYSDLGEFLVKSSQILIAVWDGKEGRDGGTAEVVHRKLGTFRARPEAHCCPAARPNQRLHTRGMVINSLGVGPVFRIAAQRTSSTDSSPQASAGWMYPERNNSSGRPACEEFAAIYLLLDEYNRDVLSHPRLTAAADRRFQKEAVSDVLHCTPGMRWAAGLRSWTAELAAHFKTQDDRILKAVFVCLFVAGFALHAIEPLKEAFALPTWGYYLGIACGSILWGFENGWFGYLTRRMAERFHTFRPQLSASHSHIDTDAPLAWHMPRKGLKFQRKHEDYRSLSEALRVQYNWLACGIEEMAAEEYLNKHAGDMIWVRDATSDVLLYEFDTVAKAGNHDLLSESLAQKWVDAQAKFFTNAVSTLDNRKRIFNRAGTALFLLAFLSPALRLGLQTHYKNLGERSMMVFTFGAPLAMLCAVLVWSFADLKGYEQEAQQYAQMQAFYGRAKVQLETLIRELNEAGGDGPDDKKRREERKARVREFLQHLGRDALVESGDWLSMHRGRDLRISNGAGG